MTNSLYCDLVLTIQLAHGKIPPSRNRPSRGAKADPVKAKDACSTVPPICWAAKAIPIPPIPNRNTAGI